MTDQPFSLLRNLVKVETPTADRAGNKLAFVDAMSRMGVESVFDIVRG
jgi:hypothetical protein